MISGVQELPETLALLHEELGIASHYAASCGLPLCAEPAELGSIGCDLAWRERYLAVPVIPRWRIMCAAAASDSICLQVVSAYRSIEYQAELFRSKLQRGETIDTILRVNAAPGFSEHHSGRALDLTTPGCESLSESFENSPAFAWLTEHAAQFGFDMSFPRDNPWGIDYEPWHWCARAELNARLDQ